VNSIPAVGLAAVFAVCGLAQHGGQISFGSNRVVLPGTGFIPAPRTQPPVASAGFSQRPVSPTNGHGDFHHRYRPPVVVPFAYPIYVGGYGYTDSGYGGYGGYGAGYGYAPDQQQSYAPPQQMPQVVINQNFIPERATPVMRDYTDDASGVQVYEAPGRQPVDTSGEEYSSYYLIAFKDHSIYSAFAYWVEGDTLHYVTPQRVHNQASLSLVDRELTATLNRDRNMQVKLPK
jgi:hypothetical protein